MSFAWQPGQPSTNTVQRDRMMRILKVHLVAVATKGISIEVLNGILSVGRHGLLRPVEFSLFT